MLYIIMHNLDNPDYSNVYKGANRLEIQDIDNRLHEAPNMSMNFTTHSSYSRSPSNLPLDLW
jgi:hypothetical protein